MKNDIHMESIEKEQYVAPAIEVVEVKSEGVICASGEDFEWD